MTDSGSTPADAVAAALAHRRSAILDRVAQAAKRSGRPASQITVVAVTKSAGMDEIRQLIALGHRDLGESRVQQLAQRIDMLRESIDRSRQFAGFTPNQSSGDAAADPAHPPCSEAFIEAARNVRWHMIGRLQRNKIKKLVGEVSMIHSVESLKLAEALEQAVGKDNRLDILLQINVSGEESKQGIPLRAASSMAEQLSELRNIRLRGLMTMAPYTEDMTVVRDVFRRLAEEYHEIRHRERGGPCFDVLSMGMSHDYPVAIEEGANMVRIGTAFFTDETESA